MQTLLLTILRHLNKTEITGLMSNYEHIKMSCFIFKALNVITNISFISFSVTFLYKEYLCEVILPKTELSKT